MIKQAAALFPGTRFEVGDMLELAAEDTSAAGVLAFYAIVHFTPDQLTVAIHAIHRVLRKGSVAILSFHVELGTVHHKDFLESGAELDFFFFEVEQVQQSLVAAGFDRMETHIRGPYESEYPSERCYSFVF